VLRSPPACSPPYRRHGLHNTFKSFAASPGRTRDWFLTRGDKRGLVSLSPPARRFIQEKEQINEREKVPMSIENNEVPSIDESAIRAESQRILSNLASKHNRSIDSFDAEIVDRAVGQAKINLEQAAKDESNVYKRLYEQERQQREVAENTLQSIRTQGVKHSSPAGGPPVSAEQARARAGAFEWNHKLTDTQKIAALGVDPSTVNLAEAKKIFGRGANAQLGVALHKADPAKYKVLREVSMAVGSYGN
jgi:hypothetical protein